jgi:hypothetical protein
LHAYFVRKDGLPPRLSGNVDSHSDDLEIANVLFQLSAYVALGIAERAPIGVGQPTRVQASAGLCVRIELAEERGERDVGLALEARPAL